MKVVAVIQARVGSTRLPAKVMLDLGGVTALERCVERVRRFDHVDEVVVATTTRPEDDLLLEVCRRIGVQTTRGSVDDVLSRYVETARIMGANAVVRCTSDCPLLDPAESSRVVRAFVDASVTSTPLDYASNCLVRRLPRGLDTEIVSTEALERAHAAAGPGPDREHVTLHIYRHPELFRTHAVLPERTEDLSGHRWTLDTLDDYRLLSAVFARLGRSASTASLDDVLGLFRADPALQEINARVEQKRVDAAP